MKALRHSLRALAEELGVSLSSLQEARKTGRVTIPKHGPVDVEALRAEWVASSKVQGPAPMAERAAPAVEPDDAQVSLAEARRRKELASARLKELEFEITAGKYCLAEDVYRERVKDYTAIRTRLLELPTRVKQAVPHLTPKEVEVVRDLIREALTELSEDKS